MLDVDWDVQEVDGPPPASAAADQPATDAVALVGVVVRNDTPVPRRVRVRSALAGPVLPPRRRGVPESGWTRDGYEGTVPAEGRLALGFAAAGPADGPPVEVVDRGRADGDEADDPTPSDLLRDLGSPAPPREAVPVGYLVEGEEERTAASAEDGAASVPSNDPPGGGVQGSTSDDDRSSRPLSEQVPTHVSTWLDAVEDRIGRGATEPGDRAALQQVADRAAALAGACPAGEGASLEVPRRS